MMRLICCTLLISIASICSADNVIHVQTFGALPQDGEDDRAAIQAAIDAAMAEQAKNGQATVVQFDAGIYNLSEPKLNSDGKQLLVNHLLLKNATNLTLRGAASRNGKPATIIERNVPELKNRMATSRLIFIQGGADLTLENLILDNSPRFASAGVCVNVDNENDAVEVEVFEGNPHFDGMDACSANVWDLENRDLKPGVPHLSIGTSPRNFPESWRSVSRDRGRRYRIEKMGFARHLEVGDGVSWHFNVDRPSENMLKVNSTDGLTLQNVHITNGPAAVVAMRDVADLTCRHVKLAPAGDQLAVGPRDGFYTAGSRGDYLYENCVFSGVRWDPLPLFDKLAYVEEMIDARTARMFWYRNETYDIGDVDALLWLKGASPVRTKIVSQHWEGADRRNKNKSPIHRGTVTFAEDVPSGFGAGSIFTPLRRTSTIIRNCKFENNYGRSPYLSGVNVLIEGNLFRNNGYAFALGISSPGAGGFVHDVVIRNNIFENCAWSSVSGDIRTSGAIRFYEQQRYEFSDEPYHSQVLIENNTFRNVGLRPSYAAIDVRNARDFIIRGNTYIDSPNAIQIDKKSTDMESIIIEDQ